MDNSYLQHHGIKGMKWGVRRFQDKNGRLTNEGKFRYAKESSKTIKINKDGSETIPKGFVFNRVGKATTDVNQSGALYVSYGDKDAARYVKSLGPTKIGKLLGQYGEAIQHISVKQNLKMPSDEFVAIETAKLLMSDEKLLNNFNRSLYSSVVTGNLEKDVTTKDIQDALKDPMGKSGQKLSFGVSSILADPNYVNEAKVIYDHFRQKGYDALPDVHDRLSGTSETAMIIINPEKVEITSVTMISKNVMKSGKSYVREIGKLPVSELID